MNAFGPSTVRILFFCWVRMLLSFHILVALIFLASQDPEIQDPEMNFTHFKFTHSLKLLWGKFASLFLIPNCNFEKE